MQKVVMVLLILLVVGLGVWVWLKPVEEIDPTNPEEKYAICLKDSQIIANFVKAIIAEDSDKCEDIKNNLLREYCNAWYKHEKACLSLEEEGEKAVCFAILKRDIEQCGDDYFCYGIIGDLEDCKEFTNLIYYNQCAALVRRDVSAFNAGTGCNIVKELFTKQLECFKTARSVEEAQACDELVMQS